MRRIALLALATFLNPASIVLASSRYYVSNAGDDKNDGQSESTAWKTVSKVNTTKFAPGDQILFQRGGEWHDALIATADGDASNPITYADYGNGNTNKPTFWGSDVISPIAFTSFKDSIYSVQLSSLPTSHAFYVFANHEFLAFSLDATKLPAKSFCVSESELLINTGGIDPRTDKTIFTATDRAAGTNADSSLICSNGHSHLIFRNLVGRETAGAPTAGGVPDAYVFRIQGSNDVHLENCDAINGGKHHIGVINSTGFVGKNLSASGCIPGLGFGNAGAFVSFSDESRHGDTSEWIDCKVDHFDPNQTAFVTHGAGLGKLTIQNLQAIGCNIAIGTDNPAEVVSMTGGLLTGPTCDVYGTNITIDHLRLREAAKIDIFGNNNTVQNCIDDGSTNVQGGIVVRGKSNTIRSCQLNHDPAHGPCIVVKASASGTQIISNSFANQEHAINDEGAADVKVANDPQP